MNTQINTTEKAPSETSANTYMSQVTKIIVACNVGIGSSAMGANLLARKIKSANLDISVSSCAIKNLPTDVDIVVTHKNLTPSAIECAGHAKHLSLTNFLDSKFYDELVSELTAAQ